MAVRVDEVKLAKSGKCFNVVLSGSKYLANLDSGLNANVGRWIEAEIGPQKDPKFPPWIGKWVHAANPQDVAPVQQHDERNPPPDPSVHHLASPAEKDNIAPWYWPSVSNICAAAIEKGIITAPEQLNMWALKWAQVCVATKEAVK